MTAHSSAITRKDFKWLITVIDGDPIIRMMPESNGTFRVTLVVPFSCPSLFPSGKLVPRLRNGKEISLCRFTPEYEAKKTFNYFKSLLELEKYNTARTRWHK